MKCEKRKMAKTDWKRRRRNTPNWIHTAFDNARVTPQSVLWESNWIEEKARDIFGFSIFIFFHFGFRFTCDETKIRRTHPVCVCVSVVCDSKYWLRQPSLYRVYIKICNDIIKEMKSNEINGERRRWQHETTTTTTAPRAEWTNAFRRMRRHDDGPRQNIVEIFSPKTWLSFASKCDRTIEWLWVCSSTHWHRRAHSRTTIAEKKRKNAFSSSEFYLSVKLASRASVQIQNEATAKGGRRWAQAKRGVCASTRQWRVWKQTYYVFSCRFSSYTSEWI